MSAHADPRVELARWQRSLLPAGLMDDGERRRSPGDWVVDVLATVLAFAAGAVLLAVTWQDHSHALQIVDAVLGALSIAALWLRRSHPAAVGVGTTAVSAVSAMAGVAGLIALYGVAHRSSWRMVAVVSALSAAAAAAYPAIYPGEDSHSVNVPVGVLLTVVVVGWGLFARARRELVRSLQDRAARLETEQRLHVEQAREAERRRIAREMHDVLAHRVSLLSLHAGALEFRPDAPPEEIAHAAGVIRTSANAVMQELREVIGVLREDEPGIDRPQPTLAEIPALIEESRAAGMRVHSRVDADADVAAATGRTAYRIVQEGLTNARKHAPSAAVSVTVAARAEGGLEVEVVSRRAVGAPAATQPPGSGTGLIGLAERVALAGGEFHHGWREGGDHVLRATLP
ncbi:MAG TPA: histidine kinase [Solirubrobacteraceae bacterium]|nr:histidine kinase [Solirubrobacteraceae bacterium]